MHTHHRSAAFDAQIATRGLKNIHLLYTSHNVFFGKRKILQFALRKTIVVAVGNDVKDNLTGYYHIPEDRVLVIRNSIEKSESQYDGELFDRREGYVHACFLGRITEVKGVDVLLKAFAKVEASGQRICLAIIGDGNRADDYKKLAVELNLKEVYFAGYRKNAAALIDQFDFVILPSWQEGFPLTIIESFASGKPVIASNIPGNNEVIKDRENGLLFTPGNTEELAQKILLLCNDQDLLSEMGDAAQKEYDNSFSYQVFINNYKEAYRIAGAYK